MRSQVSEDPFAGEAQWGIDVARARLPAALDIAAWYETQPIPSLGDQTAAALVRSGKDRMVVTFLESLVDAHSNAEPGAR
ncbi:hypothetical protein [Tahibacter soli]|uniref:Uncharacterized protein n=1 Tax=Tahibacter soli TaxID=2983605 RepID=A0A9X3YQ71_9GAMM|nr:hypothetical protein [Tahibacter soli]MDC8015425.1 hypothetical protein [Tahibacter soli]